MVLNLMAPSLFLISDFFASYNNCAESFRLWLITLNSLNYLSAATTVTFDAQVLPYDLTNLFYQFR